MEADEGVEGNADADVDAKVARTWIGEGSRPRKTLGGFDLVSTVRSGTVWAHAASLRV